MRVRRGNAEQDRTAACIRKINASLLDFRLTPTVSWGGSVGWGTKAWTTKGGRRREGSRWEKASLRKLLTNPVYMGKVSYRGVTYAGVRRMNRQG